MKHLGYGLTVVACAWFALVVYVVRASIIMRETGLAPIAHSIDKLPAPVAALVFQVLWIVFLFGWLVPAFLSFRMLRSSGGGWPT
jgi:hypothetical protein